MAFWLIWIASGFERVEIREGTARPGNTLRAFSDYFSSREAPCIVLRTRKSHDAAGHVLGGIFGSCTHISGHSAG
jgi:hypothetical protein